MVNISCDFLFLFHRDEQKHRIVLVANLIWTIFFSLDTHKRWCKKAKNIIHNDESNETKRSYEDEPEKREKIKVKKPITSHQHNRRTIDRARHLDSGFVFSLLFNFACSSRQCERGKTMRSPVWRKILSWNLSLFFAKHTHLI